MNDEKKVKTWFEEEKRERNKIKNRKKRKEMNQSKEE